MDERKDVTPAPQQLHQPFYPPRRLSSVPLPDSRFHPIAIPSVSFFAPTSRLASPVLNISRNARMIIGQRRPSSALPYFGRTSWGVDDIPIFSAPTSNFYDPSQSSLQRDESPLPDPDTSLFEQNFLNSNFGFSVGSGDYPASTFDHIFSNLPPHAASGPSASYNVGPMDHISPQDLTLSMDSVTASHLDLQHSSAASAASWTHTPMELPNSGPSSSYSGSPARSDLSLPPIAPQPQHIGAGMTFEMWHDMGSSCQAPEGKMTSDQVLGHVDMATQHFGAPVAVAGLDVGADQQMHVPGFDMLFNGPFTGMEGF